MNFRLICFLSGALLTSSLQAGEHFWDEVPLTPSTTVPREVLDDYWDGQFRRVNREVAAAQDTRLVFFGDSITWFWSLGNATGRQVWEDQFAAYNPINMGNSGDITPVMLHRVTRGNLDFPDGRHPRVAVLPVANPAKWERCRRVNKINAGLARDPSEVAFINLQDRFLQSDGTLNRELYTDGLHLNAQGYRAWAEGITPLVKEFMKAPPLTPAKIMLIGGSVTEGLDSSGCYRRYLDGMLRRSGQLIDFVGSRNQHHNDQTKPDSYQFDPDHEGHWDKDSAWIAEKIASLLDRNVPDLAVIALGVEDIASSTTAAEPLTDGIVHNINRVIGALRSKNPQVKIVVAKAVAKQGKEPATELLNHKILMLARAPAAGLSPVVVAEADRGFDWKQDMDEGGLSPNAGGARKLAMALAEAINLLSPLTSPTQRRPKPSRSSSNTRTPGEIPPGENP